MQSTAQAKALRRKARALAKHAGIITPVMNQAQAEQSVRLRSKLAALALDSDPEKRKAARQRKKALNTITLRKGQGLGSFWRESNNNPSAIKTIK